MKAQLTLAAIFATAIAAQTARANTFYRFSGHNCVARDANDKAWWYDSVGVRNNTTTADDMHYTWCPVTGWQNPTVDIDSAQLFYYDGSSYASVQCQLFMTTNTGSVYNTGVKYSCSTDTTNGCASASPSMLGYGSMKWTTTELPNAGSSIANVGPYGYFCGVPAETHYTGIQYYTEWYSRMLSYVVEQVGA